MYLLTVYTIALWGAIVFAMQSWTSWLNPGKLVRSDSRDHIEKGKQTNVGRAKDEIFSRAKQVADDVKEGAAYYKSGQAEEDAVKWTKNTANRVRNTASDMFFKMRQRLVGVRSSADSIPAEGRHMEERAQIRVLPDEYLVFIDTPGIPLSLLHVQCSKNQLLVFGDHEECINRSKVQRACWERTIDEVFDLPEDADQDHIQSWLHLQVLAIRIPRKTLQGERIIQVGQKSTFDRILENVGLEDVR